MAAPYSKPGSAPTEDATLACFAVAARSVRFVGWAGKRPLRTTMY